MDFESAINSLSDLSEASDIKKKSEQEIVLTHKESSVTLLKEDFWDFKFLILFDYFKAIVASQILFMKFLLLYYLLMINMLSSL